MNAFSSRIIQWQKRHGRHTLPWQGGRDPYLIWLSEIMLQQTRVATVIPYFDRFVRRFPTLPLLAAATEDEVLALWSGLGYYSRARNLHAAARALATEYAGQFPVSPEQLTKLPGIGRSTAAAIAALAFGRRHAILDGNVKRVLARHGGVSGWPGDKQVEVTLWRMAESRLPTHSIEAYTQGLMDLGSAICTRSRPLCPRCPVNSDCVAYSEQRTAELPTPRPKKTLPEKQIQMLLMVNQGALLLEKRPSHGIWGGLWSLPELEMGVDPVTHCLGRFGVASAIERRLTTVVHCFTHFRLHIQPTVVQPASRPEVSGHCWLALETVSRAALPAPVRKLIASLGDPERQDAATSA
ncbi:MAG: A/G-specific adenine glycosylase [Thiobacillus sp.]|nr:A/G-specific adenine glycosylase [Thiobacillus sp.]